jgi:hypothetical protein
MPSYVCVHGHFYQPPRESPWLELIEPQPSAAPHPDWNARITAECYRPNARSRVVDGQGRIVDIVDNYARMSFNVGPTLLEYLAREAADVHADLIAADVASRARFGGHGSAMAQAYGHLIMPLASDADRRTQVRWGIADFTYRFGRAPEGMWLPECAVDVPSLEALAEHGIAFTILAPHQARRWRRLGTSTWDSAGGVDTRRVYRCNLPSGRYIDLFFYDGATSRAVAFERLLVDGGRLAARLRAGLGTGPQAGGLSHIATDGESYGHHHKFGDMALAWALTAIDEGAARGGPQLTNYGQFRELEPATWEVEIHERSSWSCAHGVERWQADCGCSSGGQPTWNQAWRAPLRAALDWLARRLARVYAVEGAALLRDPAAARDAYIDVMLARDDDALDAWLDAHALPDLSPAEEQRARELAEMQRHAMAMFTSCGWFFDDLSGIETVQCLRYAARAIELAERGPAVAMGGEFVDRLAQARSNLPAEGDGRQVWQRHVEPARRSAGDVVAHAAVEALLGGGPVGAASTPPSTRRLMAWDVTTIERVERQRGTVRLLAVDARATSWLTGEQLELACAALLHHGDGGEVATVVGGVEPFPGAVAWHALVDELIGALERPGASDAAVAAAATEVIGRHVAGPRLGLGSLLGDDRARLVTQVALGAVSELHAELERAYQAREPLLRLLHGAGLPLPPALVELATVVLRQRVRAVVERHSPDFGALQAVLEAAELAGVSLDTPGLAHAAGDALRELVCRVELAPEPAADGSGALSVAVAAATLATRLRSPVELWDAQNVAWRLHARQAPRWRARAAEGDDLARRQLERLDELCAALRLAPRS